MRTDKSYGNFSFITHALPARPTQTEATLDTSTAYAPPEITILGDLFELTLYCDKRLGLSDGWTFQGDSIVCTSP